MTSHNRTASVVRSALLAALLAVSALIVIPLGPVPATAQTLVVMLIALVCTPREATVTMAVYLAVGAAGMPVFSGARGGIAVLVGPTGGYLAGFALGAVTGALLRSALARIFARRMTVTSQDALQPRSVQTLVDVAAALSTLIMTYALGVAWLAKSTGAPLFEAAALGVLPFLPGEALKVPGAILVAGVLRRAGLVHRRVC